VGRPIYDITRTLNPAIAVWPGDSRFSITRVADLEAGDPATVTRLTLSSHTGTHVDAPAHVGRDDLSLENVSLAPFIGPATVVTVPRQAGPLTPADFPALDWARIRRLLIHSPASSQPPDQFLAEFLYPSPALADFMGQHGLVLFGTDAPSVDPVNSDTLPGHQALGRNKLAILEGIVLAGVPDGEYELIALPLKIEGGDGSPVRAVLRAWG
jgi:arylformamidase